MTITSQLNLGSVPSTNPKGSRVFSFTGTESTVNVSHKILTIPCYKTTQTQRQAEKLFFHNSSPEPHSTQKVEPTFYIHDFDYLKQTNSKSGACGRLGCLGQRVISHHIPEGPLECCICKHIKEQATECLHVASHISSTADILRMKCKMVATVFRKISR